MTVRPLQSAVRPGGDETSGQAHEYARELVEHLAARGLDASAVPDSAAPGGMTAVTARRVDVAPYAGRKVFLLPAQGLDGLYWHWQRRFPSHPRIRTHWFQPFCRAEDVVTAIEAIDAAIDADVRARARLMHASVTGPDAAADPDREVLVYVGYRVHSLVSRMLARLKAVEKQYEDPDLLDELYALEHLATQLRRAAERMAVLGGVTARRARSPMPMSTVLRQAVAEVEQFRRVGLVLPERDVPVAGHAGPSVIHVLAELVENATRFSRRDTTVLMAPVETPDGLAVEIRDQGLPLSAEKLADLRRILVEPYETSPREQVRQGQIGVLVVARLAARLGLRVELHPEASGTLALVVFPQSLLVEPAPASNRAAAPAEHPTWHARELPRQPACVSDTPAAFSDEAAPDPPPSTATPPTATAAESSLRGAATDVAAAFPPPPQGPAGASSETSRTGPAGRPPLPRRSQAEPSPRPRRPAPQPPAKPPSLGLMAAFTAGIQKANPAAQQDDPDEPETG